MPCFTLQAQGENILQNEVDGLTIEISLDDVPARQAIWLNYEITNTSEEVVSFPYRYFWDFPIGMSAVLTRKNGKSLIRFGSRHILSDEVLSEDLSSDRVDLQPGGTLNGTVNILDMVILKNHYGDAYVNPGKYKVGLSFFGNDSNLLDVTIPKK